MVDIIGEAETGNYEPLHKCVFVTGFDCCCVLLFPCGTPPSLINGRMVVGTCCFGSNMWGAAKALSKVHAPCSGMCSPPPQCASYQRNSGAACKAAQLHADSLRAAD